MLRHLATGIPDAEMADAMYVSEATIKTHASHMFTKLEVRDMVQAAVVAYESKLVVPGS